MLAYVERGGRGVVRAPHLHAASSLGGLQASGRGQCGAWAGTVASNIFPVLPVPYVSNLW